VVETYPIEAQFSAYRKTGPVEEPPFESHDEQSRYWGERWGVDNDVGQIRQVLVHRPGNEIHCVNEESCYDNDAHALVHPEGQWYWLGREPLDLAKMQQQHDALVRVLEDEGATPVYLHRTFDHRSTKTIFTRDPLIAIPGGAIVSRLAPRMRRGEERPVVELLAQLGMPVLRMVHGTGTFSGGSFAFINPRTAVVGISCRVNEEGAQQVEGVLNTLGISLIRVRLCGWTLHLDVAFSMVDVDVALVDPTQLPYDFLCLLETMGVKTVYGCPGEYRACNVLAVRPGKVILAAGAPRTEERLKSAGIETICVDISELQRGGGSVHCLTQPLVRDPV